MQLQAVACIGLIIAGGRTLLRPIYRRMADMGNTDVFAATTLLVVLGTSVLTQIAGLSLALGAFLVSASCQMHTRHCRTHAGAHVNSKIVVGPGRVSLLSLCKT